MALLNFLAQLLNDSLLALDFYVAAQLNVATGALRPCRQPQLTRSTQDFWGRPCGRAKIVDAQGTCIVPLFYRPLRQSSPTETIFQQYDNLSGPNIKES